jgi:hypothetical protein
MAPKPKQNSQLLDENNHYSQPPAQDCGGTEGRGSFSRVVHNCLIKMSLKNHQKHIENYIL